MSILNLCRNTRFRVLESLELSFALIYTSVVISLTLVLGFMPVASNITRLLTTISRILYIHVLLYQRKWFSTMQNIRSAGVWCRVFKTLLFLNVRCGIPMDVSNNTWYMNTYLYASLWVSCYMWVNWCRWYDDIPAYDNNLMVSYLLVGSTHDDSHH